jgi:hypothetical protein
MTKPYKLLTSDIVDKEKGILNNTFVRFIGPADSIFSMFIRSFGYRQLSPDNTLNFHKYEFIIYDKNPKHIAMFKHMLTWDGILDEDNAFKNFNDHLDLGKAILKLQGTPFPRNSTLGMSSRHGFNDFTAMWELFKNSKFTFINIDVIHSNNQFCDILNNLKNIKIPNGQFLKLDFNKNDYDPEVYNEAINNILHMLWLKSFKEYQSVVELTDNNNVSYEDFAGKLYAKLNPTFCILPWMHVQYKPSGQSKPCCRYDNNKEDRDYQEYLKNPEERQDNLSELFLDRAKNLVIQKSTIEETFNSTYWDKARTLTQENKPISGCYKCYAEEQVPGEVSVSMRLGSNIMYNNGYLHKKPNFAKPSLEFLEVGFGNYCNLACLSCNSSLSTTWYDNEVELNEVASPGIKRMVFPKLDNIRFDLNKETLESLKLVKFTGGEPMINPEFIKFIDLICEKGHPENISLEIYTNCSYIPAPKLLANLVKFKNIQLNLSIDAYGVTNDYVRYGSKWDGDNKQTVSRAIDFWLEQGVNNKSINIIMSTTLSILNVFEIPKLMPWWMKKFKDSGNKVVVHRKGTLPTEYEGFFKLQMAFDPSYIDMNILPQDYYKDIEKWSDEYEANFTKEYPDLEFIPESISASLNKLKNTIKRSKGDPKNARLLLEYLAKMDKIRNNSAEASIPEVVSKVKEYLLAQDKPQ